MKKGVLLLICLLLLTACSRSEKVDTGSLEKADHSTQTEVEGVSLVTDYPDYSQETPEIYFILTNNSSDTLVQEWPVVLEYQYQNEWYKVPLKEGLDIAGEEIDTPSGGRRSERAGLDPEVFDFSFPTGRYRLALPYLYGETEFPGTVEPDHIAFAEFDLVKKADRVEYQQFVEQLYDIEGGLDNGLVFIRDQIEGQEVIDRFIDRSLCGVPAEMRIVDPEQDIIQHYYYKDGCYTVQEYVDRAVTTRCYSFLYFDPEVEEVFLSNYVDPAEAAGQGYRLSEPEEILQIGPTTENNISWIKKETDHQKEDSSCLMRVYLFGKDAYVGIYEEMSEKETALGYANQGMSEILPKVYSLDDLHPVLVRPLTETAAVVFFASPDGESEEMILDVTKGRVQE